ncbi:uncharacterized protein V1516DRAFT_656046 [Lipomyces oligophaga]|uniref:uncharacterized protein n=1 Tax=Lipomyces oligophaga TaxID=45792 RepID=UPI0034CE9497
MSKTKRPSIKTFLTTAKEAIDHKQFLKALTQCKLALEIDDSSYNAYILMGYCESGLLHYNEAEQAYYRALEINPGSPIASQGLLAVYENSKNVNKYVPVAMTLLDGYIENDDLDKGTALINRMQSFVHQFGSSKNKFDLLEYMIPGGPVYAFLEGRIPPAADILDSLATSVSDWENSRIQQKINSSRNKINVNITAASRSAKAEIWGASKLDSYYRKLLDWSNSDEQRRETEGKLLKFLHNKIQVVPEESKSTLFEEILELANGMVVIKSPIEEAWSITIEWQNTESLEDLDESLIRDYVERFPESGLSLALQAYLKSDISPFKLKNAILEENENEINLWEEEWNVTQIISALTEAYDQQPDSILIHRILAMFYLYLNEFENTVEICLAGIRRLNRVQLDLGKDFVNHRVALLLSLANADIYYEAPRHYPDALKTFQKVESFIPNHKQALIGKALISLERGQTEEALAMLMDVLKGDPSNVQALMEASWCRVLLRDFETGRKGLSSCLEQIARTDPVSQNLKAKIWWRIGKSMWEEKQEFRIDRSAAYNCFMTSLKNNANFAPAFTSLGLYFDDIEQDRNRAEKCFHRAFEIDANEEIAARRLTERFANERDWELVEVIASRFAEAEKKRSVPGSELSWPYRVLGVSYLQSHNIVQAIQSFQAALRIDKEDTNSWAGLGEAYAESGRYVAASKAFARSCSLDSKNWYSRLLLAMVHRQVLDFDEAITTFRSVLDDQPDQLVVLEHLCEALTESSKHNVGRHYYDQAIENAKEALEIASRVIVHRGNLFNVWKYVGDCLQIFLTLQSYLNELPIDTLEILFSFQEISSEVTDVFEHVDKLDNNPVAGGKVELQNTLKTAETYYVLAHKYALLVSFDNERSRSVGWFNIAMAELRLSLSRSENESAYGKAAIECFKNAIRLEPKNFEFWNAYGIAMAYRYPVIAQHAFIRSILLDHMNATSWMNLSVMYLIHGDLELAHAGFNKVQTIDPDFVGSWTGQGIISMAVGQNEEARELFEHSFAICTGYDELAHLLFAMTAFTAILNHNYMSHIEVPIYALEKVLNLLPEFVPAMELQALLLERQGNGPPGIELLNKVCTILERKYEENEAVEDLKSFVEVKAQLARLYSAGGNYEACLQNSLTAIDLSEDEPIIVTGRMSAVLTAGLAYAHMNDYMNALKMFQLAYNVSARDPDIVVLLSQVLYSLGNEERDQASDELFKTVETNPQHLQTMLLLGTIGLAEENNEIVEAIEAEIKEFNIDERMTLTSGSGYSIEKLLSAMEAFQAKHAKPEIRPWLQTAILQPSSYKVWQKIDRKTSLQTALLDERVTANDLSDEYASVGDIKSAMTAVYLSPGNANAWENIVSLVQSQ